MRGRYLTSPPDTRPTPQLGILDRATRRCCAGLCAFASLSYYCHLLLRPHDARHLVRFMGFVKGNLAKEAGRLHGQLPKTGGTSQERTSQERPVRGAQ